LSINNNKGDILFRVLRHYIDERRKPLDDALKSKDTTQLKKMFTEIQLLEIDAIDELVTYIENNNIEPLK
jgi:urocanate hydratase